jgi:hypothetical protein
MAVPIAARENRTDWEKCQDPDAMASNAGCSGIRDRFPPPVMLPSQGLVSPDAATPWTIPCLSTPPSFSKLSKAELPPIHRHVRFVKLRFWC